MPKTNEKKTHGGPRKGAGRKPSGKQQITLRMKPEAIEELKEIARWHKITTGKAVEFALDQMQPGVKYPPPF